MTMAFCLSFYDQSLEDLISICEKNSIPNASASLLFNWHYKKFMFTPLEHQDLSKKAKNFLYDYFSFTLPKIDTVHMSDDKTVKFQIKFEDNRKVEAVLIPFQGKYTLCLSSQVGCAMNCSFCYTGKQGFSRNLASHEIIGQFLIAKKWLLDNRPADSKILNVVFMGQGEPLHNFDSVKKSIQIMLSQHGLSLADHKITVSTSGYLPGLLRWKSEMPSVNIALSLHSPFNDKRSELIPINRKYPLEEIFPIIESIPQGKKRFATYEYLLIKNFNDGEEDAIALGQLLTNTKAFLNIIPFNPFPNSKYERPSLKKIELFKERLSLYKIPVTVRTTKGDDILAACGQLNVNALLNLESVPPQPTR